MKISFSKITKNLQKYLDLIEQNIENEIVLTRNGKSIAKIVPIVSTVKSNRIGSGLLFFEKKPFDITAGDEEILKFLENI